MVGERGYSYVSTDSGVESVGDDDDDSSEADQNMEGDGVMDNERTGGASVVRVTPKRFIEVWSLSFFGPVVVSWFVDVARTLAGIWVHWVRLHTLYSIHDITAKLYRQTQNNNEELHGYSRSLPISAASFVPQPRPGCINPSSSVSLSISPSSLALSSLFGRLITFSLPLQFLPSLPTMLTHEPRQLYSTCCIVQSRHGACNRRTIACLAEA